MGIFGFTRGNIGSEMEARTASRPRVNGSMLPKFIGRDVCVVAKNVEVRDVRTYVD